MFDFALLRRVLVVSSAALCLLATQGGAQPLDDRAKLNGLYDQLSQSEAQQSADIEREIERLWAQSGSAAMDMLRARGLEAFEDGDLDLAISFFSALIDLAPDYAQAWHLRAQVFAASERYGMALADLEQTLERDPRHYEALFGLGVVLAEIERFGLAEQAMRAAVDIHPHYQAAQSQLSLLQSRGFSLPI